MTPPPPPTEFWKAFSDVLLKKSFAVFWTTSIACFLFIVAPQRVLVFLALWELTQKYRPWISIGMIAGGLLGIIELIYMLVVWRSPETKEYLNQRKELARIKKRLDDLTEAEKEILRGYINGKERVITCFSIHDQAAAVLGQDGILTVIQSHPACSLDTVRIVESAWEYLNQHPEKIRKRST